MPYVEAQHMNKCIYVWSSQNKPLSAHVFRILHSQDVLTNIFGLGGQWMITMKNDEIDQQLQLLHNWSD